MSKLLWIRRRARRLMNAYGFVKGNPGQIAMAVAAACQDWQDFNPQGEAK